MTRREPIETTNLDRYGYAELPWSRAEERFEAEPAGPGVGYFLGTVRPDGRPHSAGIGTAWYEGEFYFTSSPLTRKSKNLAANPACTISASLTGIDLVLEGRATRVTDRETLEALAAHFRDGGWPAEVEDDALTAPFSAPSAGPPPWQLFRFTLETAFGVASAEPYGASRWRFGS